MEKEQIAAEQKGSEDNHSPSSLLSSPSRFPSSRSSFLLHFSRYLSSSRSHEEERAVIENIANRLYPFDIPLSPSLPPPCSDPADESAASVCHRVSVALARLARGEFLVVADARDRENEGDLIVAAEHATKEKMAFMVSATSGIICVGLSSSRASALLLPPMVSAHENSDPHQTAFTVSVDYKHGCTTGVSAEDRSNTIKALAASSTVASDFRRPGHVFPLVAKAGGVLERGGHTEASVDLCRLAGLTPVGALSEIVCPDGSMARPGSLCVWAAYRGLAFIAISDIQTYRKLKQV